MGNRMDRRNETLKPTSDRRPFLPKWTWFVAVMLLLLPAAPASSQTIWDMYIQCTGGDAGNLNSGDLSAASVGDFWDPNHLDWGGVKGYWEAAQVPMDMTGSPLGNREHAGISIVKMRSKSSPLYMDALVNKAQLSCTIEFWVEQPPPTGKLKFYSVVLTNARIASIELNGTTGNADETVTFHAEQITWTHHQASTTYSDNLTVVPP